MEKSAIKTDGIVRNILRNALKRVEKPENWCKQAYARSPDGTDLSYAIHLAGCGCSFCAQGAIIAAAATYPGQYQALVTSAVRNQIPDDSTAATVVDYNDLNATKHSDIVELFSGAIEDSYY